MAYKHVLYGALMLLLELCMTKKDYYGLIIDGCVELCIRGLNRLAIIFYLLWVSPLWHCVELLEG